MADLNSCSFIGRLGKDPEIRNAGSNKVANFSLACGERWRDKASGEMKEKTEWINCTVWGDGLVGIVEKYLRKGSRVFLQGKMQTREYEKDGAKRWATDIVLQGFDSKLILLDGKPEGGQSSERTSTSTPSPTPTLSAGNGGGGTSAFSDEFDDEVPFMSSAIAHEFARKRVL